MLKILSIIFSPKITGHAVFTIIAPVFIGAMVYMFVESLIDSQVIESNVRCERVGDLTTLGIRGDLRLAAKVSCATSLGNIELDMLDQNNVALLATGNRVIVCDRTVGNRYSNCVAGS